MLPMSQFRTQSQPRQSKLYLVKIKLATGMVGIDMMAMMSKKFLFKIVVGRNGYFGNDSNEGNNGNVGNNGNGGNVGNMLATVVAKAIR